MKTVLLDTSGFYGCLDHTDPFHRAALPAFERAEQAGWKLLTTNYLTHETWALVERRLGWKAVETFLNDLLPRCAVQWMDDNLHQRRTARCRQTRKRRCSLTSATRLERLAQGKIIEAIAHDGPFVRAKITMP